MDLFGEEYLPPIETQGAFALFAVSAAGRTGLDELLAAWWTELLRLKQTVVAEAAKTAVPLP
jgi:GTP-binding protein